MANTFTPLIRRAQRVTREGLSYCFSKYQTPTQLAANTVVYVSLGDSIAAAENINRDWSSAYGLASQYDTTGTTTTIVSGSYTEKVAEYLSEGGTREVITYNFAQSGDDVPALIEKISKDNIKEALKIADVITVSIGGETLWASSAKSITDYLLFNSPDKDTFLADYTKRFERLKTTTVEDSYYDLCTKIYTEAKAGAKVIFLDMYNPYHFLSLDEGTDAKDYTDSFFSSLLEAVPDWEADNPFTGTEILDLRKFVYEIGYDGFSLKDFSNRINKFHNNAPLSAWFEEQVCLQNEQLIATITNFKGWLAATPSTKNVIFSVAQVKKHFDSYTSPNDGEKYPVNVDFYPGQKIADLDWGAFWRNINLFDLLGPTLETILRNILNKLKTEVVTKNLDPYPTATGHAHICEAIKEAYESASISSSVSYATYHTIIYKKESETKTFYYPFIKGKPVSVTLIANPFSLTTGHYFTGWKNGDVVYQPGEVISFTSEESSTMTFECTSDNKYTATIKYKSRGVGAEYYLFASREFYQLKVNDTVKDKLNSFSDIQTFTFSSDDTFRIQVGNLIGSEADGDLYPDGQKFSKNLNITFELICGQKGLRQGFAPYVYWECTIV